MIHVRSRSRFALRSLTLAAACITALAPCAFARSPAGPTATPPQQASAAGKAPKSADDVRAANLHGEIDALLTQTFRADGPGAAVLVMHAGRVLLEKGYGLADLAAKTPITPSTNFDLASVSKQFTALAVMILADRGALDFDDDVRKYLPELPVYDPARAITIRNLLHHTSGLPDYLHFSSAKFPDFSKLENDGVLAVLADLKLAFPPGASHEYSNSNYVLLASIVSRVSKQGFGAFMRDEVFTPLGMERTRAVDDLGVAVPDRATGYRKSEGAWKKSVMDAPVCGDGNVFSNLVDLRRWIEAIDARKLVRPETWAYAFTPGVVGGHTLEYGFGWVIGRRAENRYIGHGGSWAGTRSFVGLWPEDRLAIVILSNDEGAQPLLLRVRLADIVLGVVERQKDEEEHLPLAPPQPR